VFVTSSVTTTIPVGRVSTFLHGDKGCTSPVLTPRVWTRLFSRPSSSTHSSMGSYSHWMQDCTMYWQLRERRHRPWVDSRTLARAFARCISYALHAFRRDSFSPAIGYCLLGHSARRHYDDNNATTAKVSVPLRVNVASAFLGTLCIVCIFLFESLDGYCLGFSDRISNERDVRDRKQQRTKRSNVSYSRNAMIFLLRALPSYTNH